jgi:hypothetical protein
MAGTAAAPLLIPLPPGPSTITPSWSNMPIATEAFSVPGGGCLPHPFVLQSAAPTDIVRSPPGANAVKIGVPKEIKTHEYRVGLTPAGARELVHNGHQVTIEHNAGAGIGFDDEAYTRAGATIQATAADVFETADLIVKVKEPQPQEIALLRPGQILFTYLHLAADKAQTEGLIRSKATCIAYETVTDRSGALPLLAPMSEVAGRMSIQVGCHCLEREQGGAGILLGGGRGLPPAWRWHRRPASPSSTSRYSGGRGDCTGEG